MSVFKDKDSLIKFLHYIRKSHCCYVNHVCDCKYGLADSVNEIEISDIIHNKGLYDEGSKLHKLRTDYTGEQTGCPELFTIIDGIERMDKKEFDKFFNPERESQVVGTILSVYTDCE